jgi:hypothetical protein
MNNTSLILGLGVLAGVLVGYFVRELRRRKEKRDLKQDVQRWEDEGGNVPDVRTVSPRPK